MHFFKLGKESGVDFIDALGRCYYSFDVEFSCVMKAQFCFSAGMNDLAVVSQLKLKDLNRVNRGEFFTALGNFLNVYWGELSIDGGEGYIHILMRSKGVEGGHEFYVIKTKSDCRDEQGFRTFVEDFFNFKTKGIDEIMLTKNLNIVFEDRS